MNKIRVFLILILFFWFDPAMARPRQRTLTTQQMQEYCISGRLPRRTNIVSIQGDLQAYCERFRREQNTSRERNTRRDGTGAAMTHHRQPIPDQEVASPPAQGGNPEPVADVVPEEAVEPQPVSSGGTITNSGSGVCNDSALTANIPRGNQTAPGYPTNQDAYLGYAEGEILRGNIPRHILNLAPVRMGNSNSSCLGETGPLTICTMPEPIAIGQDGNYAYPTIRLNQAVRIAREFGMILPTSYMVDAIDSAAAVNIPSRTRPWYCGQGGDCTGDQPYRLQQQSDFLTNAVRTHSNYTPGAIVSGTHKDYALSHRLPPNGSGGFTHMSLYGWNGIQSGRDRLQHTAGHIDYSQVPRFVSQWVQVGNRWERMSTLLADRNCARILNGGRQIGANVTNVFNTPNLPTPGNTNSSGGRGLFWGNAEGARP